MVKPYTEEIHENVIIREFSERVDERLLVWHRDENNRIIVPIESNGWMFQRDDQPPEELIEYNPIMIKSGEYHRVIKGKGKLIIEIYNNINV